MEPPTPIGSLKSEFPNFAVKLGAEVNAILP